MDRFVFEKCVCDLQIVHYTEFDHFFTVNVDFAFCVFADDVGREVVKFRIRFGIEISTNDYGFSGFECFDYWWQLFVEVTRCFKILQGGFEGRRVCTDNVGYDVTVSFNFHHADSFGDWYEGDIWVWSYYYTSSCYWSVFMTKEIKM